MREGACLQRCSFLFARGELPNSSQVGPERRTWVAVINQGEAEKQQRRSDRGDTSKAGERHYMDVSKGISGVAGMQGCDVISTRSERTCQDMKPNKTFKN